jgi:hypothetical protein
MAWEGYWSRYGKYNDFNVYGLFGRDSQIRYRAGGEVGVKKTGAT